MQTSEVRRLKTTTPTPAARELGLPDDAPLVVLDECVAPTASRWRKTCPGCR